MINEIKYRVYCGMHLLAKKILGKSNLSVGNMLFIPSMCYASELTDAIEDWKSFMDNAIVKDGSFKNFLYAGYIVEKKTWCLPSWIWTNAASVRTYCLINRLDKAISLAENIATQQQECGGWIVRNDYDKRGPIPMLAPNDSAYIANNAFLTLYEKTQNEKYLNIAKKCADWIIETVRPDGMVYVGFNKRDEKWDTSCVIVDVGFTAGLFSHLAEITRDNKYIFFLKKFVERYIELFYIPLIPQHN